MNFFDAHFTDFRNDLTSADKKFKYLRVISSFMVFKRNHSMSAMKKIAFKLGSQKCELELRLNNFIFQIFNQKEYIADRPTHVIIPTSGYDKQPIS